MNTTRLCDPCPTSMLAHRRFVAAFVIASGFLTVDTFAAGSSIRSLKKTYAQCITIKIRWFCLGLYQ